MQSYRHAHVSQISGARSAEDVGQGNSSSIPRYFNTQSYIASGIYTFPCDATLSLALSFSGFDFSIDMRDFNLGMWRSRRVRQLAF